MLVEVTMHPTHATIESEDKKQTMHVPMIRSLVARMAGQTKARFEAEIVHGSLELGERVR